MVDYNSYVDTVRDYDEFETFLKSYYSDLQPTGENLELYYLISQRTESFSDQLERIDEFYGKFDIESKVLDAKENRELLRVEMEHRKQKNIVSGTVLYEIDHEKNMVRGITDSGKEVTESAIQITNKMYPVFERLFLSSYLLRSILEDFIGAGYSGRATQITTQKWWDKDFKPKSAVEYPTDIPLDIVLDEFQDPGKVLKMFSGVISADGRDLLKLYINRDGRIKYKDGRYELFKEVVNSIESYAEEEVKKFSDIEKGSDDHSFLEVKFEELSKEEPEKEVIERFRNAIQKEQIFQEAVMHSGNPYYHSSVADREDGSSFEVMLTSEGDNFTLNILPNYSLSSISVLKFKRTVFQEFGEGEIEKIERGGG